MTHTNEIQNVICSCDKKVGHIIKHTYVLLFTPYQELFHKNKSNFIQYRSRILFKLDEKKLSKLTTQLKYSMIRDINEYQNNQDFIEFTIEDKIGDTPEEEEEEEEKQNQNLFDIDKI